MKTGIVGLRQTGKTTIFNILTGAGIPTGVNGKEELHLGVATMIDSRMDRLVEIHSPRKVTPATAHFVDTPGVEPDEMREPAFLGNLRQVDGLAHVVRAFEDAAVAHSADGIDPGRDIENMELEMIMADLFQAERRLERLDKDLRKMRNADMSAERDALRKVRDHLSDEQPLRELELTLDDERRIRGFTFLSRKPVMHLINMDEDSVPLMETVVDHFGLETWNNRPGVSVIGVCGKIEEEISQLEPDDAREFLNDLGIPQSGMIRLLNENYRLLRLMTFFTVGPDEVRAWTVREGSTARQAAGAIHSDLEKGFIRAEIAPYDHMDRLGSYQALKEEGLLRVEGKDYILQNGEIMVVRFNV
jgi:GTP-binding protein YchF